MRDVRALAHGWEPSLTQCPHSWCAQTVALRCAMLTRRYANTYLLTSQSNGGVVVSRPSVGIWIIPLALRRSSHAHSAAARLQLLPLRQSLRIQAHAHTARQLTHSAPATTTARKRVRRGTPSPSPGSHRRVAACRARESKAYPSDPSSSGDGHPSPRKDGRSNSSAIAAPSSLPRKVIMRQPHSNHVATL